MKIRCRYWSVLALFLMLSFPIGGQVLAEAPPPFKDFQAKRVKAPEKGSRPSIDVQIGQDQAAVSQPEAVRSSAVTQRAGRYSWFWETVSPSLEDKSSGRLWPALQQLAQPPSGQGVDVMRLQELQDIATSYHRAILLATVGTKVSPALVLSIIAVESSGDLRAESDAGAQGLMQLMPDTVTRFGVEDPFVAAENIKGGVAFLEVLMDRFGGDPVLVLAGYNAGERAVREAGGVPDFAQTRDYVPKVLATYAVARGLCKTPPELLTDGCVFITR